MKVLVILSGPAGNIIFSTPLIRAIKIDTDITSIWYLTSDEGASLLADNLYIDRVLVRHDAGDMRDIRKEEFSYIIDLDANASSWWIATRLSGKVLRFDTRWWLRWMLVRLRINKFIPIHLVDQYLATAKELGVRGDGLRPDFSIPYKDEVPLDWLPSEFQKGYVLFCIGASYATRRLPVNRMIELCDRINKPVILIGSKDDVADGEEVERFFSRNSSDSLMEEKLMELNKKGIVYNACGKFNFNQQASLVRHAKYVFTFDNDFVAVASAFRKETFVLYGNTVLDFGSYPSQTRFTILENNKLTCRPCSSKGYGRCPLKHFRCMNDLVFDFYLW